MYTYYFVKRSQSIVFQLEKRQIAPPFKPTVDAEDAILANFDNQFTSEPVQLTPDDP